MKINILRHLSASKANFSTSSPSLTSQRRCTLGAIAAVCGFVALPVLTSRAQNTPAAPATPAGVPVETTTTKAEVPLVPGTDRPCLTPPPGLSLWLSGENTHRDIYANKVQIDEKQTYEAGKVGQAFSMKGTHLRVLASPKTDVGSGVGFTWEAWVNPSDVLPMHPIFDYNNGETFGVHLWIFNGNGGLMANFMDISGMPHMVDTQPGVLKAGEWQHIALTYDKRTSVGSIYVNGLVVGEKTLGPFRPQTTYDLFIGYRPAGLGKDRRFLGAIDEIGLYARPLAATEIKSIFNAGAAGKCNPQTAKPVTLPPASKTAPTPTPTPTPAPTPTPTPTIIPALKLKPPIAIFTLAGAEGVSPDAATRITDALTEELRKAGWQVKPRQHMDKLFNTLSAEPANNELAADVRAAALRRKATTQMLANTILFGRIEQLDLSKNQARLKLNLQLIDAASNKALPDIVVSESTAEKPTATADDELLTEVIAKTVPLALERIRGSIQK
jgi:hypothetical protein